MSRKEEYNDDGRIIADMNVDNAPWTDGSRFDAFRIVPKFNSRRHNAAKQQPSISNEAKSGESPLADMTQKEFRGTMLAVMASSLLVLLVFIGGSAMFLLFCLKVWFKY